MLTNKHMLIVKLAISIRLTKSNQWRQDLQTRRCPALQGLGFVYNHPVVTGAYKA